MGDADVTVEAAPASSFPLKQFFAEKRVGQPTLQFAFVFKDFCPVLDQLVERFLGGAFTCDDIGMHPVLHRQQK